MNRIFCGKRLFVFVFILLYAVSYSMAAELTLKLGVVTPPKTDTTFCAVTFAERVDANTNGRVKVKVYDSSQFGNQAEHWAQVRSGAIDLNVSDMVNYAFAEPKPKNTFVLATPFLFDNAEHYHKFLESEICKSMISRIEKAAGIKHVGYGGDRPPRCFSTTKVEAQVPADIKGLKLRVPGHVVIVAAYKAWGASPTPLAAAEIYNGIKTGLVVGLDESFVNAYQFAGELVKYCMNTEYMRTGFAIKMNGKKWDSMSKEFQAAFTKAAAETDKIVTQFSNDRLGERRKLLEKNGAKIVEIADKGPWKAAVSKVVAKFEGDLWEKGLYQKIRDLSK